MSSETRERIVAVARDMVHRSSFAQVGVADVCRAAGVHKGSLYHFFPSKDALGAAVLERNGDLVRAVMDGACAAAGSPLGRIDGFVAAFAEVVAAKRAEFGSTPGCPLGDLAAELAAVEGPLRGDAERALARYAGFFTEAVADAQRVGEVDPRLDPEEAGLAVAALVQGMAVLAKAGDDPGLIGRLRPQLRLLLPAP